MERKLDIMETFKDAIAIGTKNAVPLLLTVLTYLLTCWIPYFNIGTTIAMATLPSKLAQGKTISPNFIFDSVYRRQIGNYLLFEGLYVMIILPTILSVLFIPALPVLFIMYCLSLFILFDEETNPIEALELSRKATYGFKWKIFFIFIIFIIAIQIIPSIIALPLIGIGALINNFSDDPEAGSSVYFFGWLIIVAFTILGICCGYALYAVIYSNLYLNVRQPQEPSPQTEIETTAQKSIEADRWWREKEDTTSNTPVNSTDSQSGQ